MRLRPLHTKPWRPFSKTCQNKKGLAIIAVHLTISPAKTQSFSQNVMDLYGTGSIAEAAALAAAGSEPACLLHTSSAHTIWSLAPLPKEINVTVHFIGAGRHMIF